MIPRRELFEYIWPRQIASNEALTKLIGRLRDMLGMYGARVVTVRGRGVRLDATVRRLETPPVHPKKRNEIALAAKPSEPEPALVPLMERPIVLIVDDSPDSVLLLTETLKDKYRTKIATSGAAAIRSGVAATAAGHHPHGCRDAGNGRLRIVQIAQAASECGRVRRSSSSPARSSRKKKRTACHRRGGLHHQTDFATGGAGAHRHASQTGERAAHIIVA